MVGRDVEHLEVVVIPFNLWTPDGAKAKWCEYMDNLAQGLRQGMQASQANWIARHRDIDLHIFVSVLSFLKSCVEGGF
jgi:hypothetical protein